MGSITSSRVRQDGKVVFEVVMDYEESLNLKGHFDNIHIFSEEIADKESVISIKGLSDSTRYLLIPKELRKGINIDGKVKCHRIDTRTKTMFIYVIDKLSF